MGQRDQVILQRSARAACIGSRFASEKAHSEIAVVNAVCKTSVRAEKQRENSQFQTTLTWPCDSSAPLLSGASSVELDSLVSPSELERKAKASDTSFPTVAMGRITADS